MIFSKCCCCSLEKGFLFQALFSIWLSWVCLCVDISIGIFISIFTLSTFISVLNLWLFNFAYVNSMTASSFINEIQFQSKWNSISHKSKIVIYYGTEVWLSNIEFNLNKYVCKLQATSSKRLFKWKSLLLCNLIPEI